MYRKTIYALGAISLPFPYHHTVNNGSLLCPSSVLGSFSAEPTSSLLVMCFSFFPLLENRSKPVSQLGR